MELLRDLSINSSSKTDDIAERRIQDRFKLLDQETWQLRVNNKKYPLEWLHDLSKTGMQLRQGTYNSFSKGQEVEVDLEFMGLKFFKVKACVKWLAEDQDRLNMKVMGLEFEDPKRQVLRNWKKHNMNRFLEPMDAPTEKPSKAKQKSHQLPLLHFAEMHITGILLASFLISMAF